MSAGLVTYFHPRKSNFFWLSRSVLSQAKQKIPLLLPGFESIEIAEEHSAPFSEEVNSLYLVGAFVVGELPASPSG